MKAFRLKINSPCKDCEKRHRACWDSCADYKDYIARKDGLKTMRYNDINMEMCTYEYDSKVKNTRLK